LTVRHRHDGKNKMTENPEKPGRKYELYGLTEEEIKIVERTQK